MTIRRGLLRQSEILSSATAIASGVTTSAPAKDHRFDPDQGTRYGSTTSFIICSGSLSLPRRSIASLSWPSLRGMALTFLHLRAVVLPADGLAQKPNNRLTCAPRIGGSGTQGPSASVPWCRASRSAPPFCPAALPMRKLNLLPTLCAETEGSPTRAGPSAAFRRSAGQTSIHHAREDNFAWYQGVGEGLLTIPGVNRASTCTGSGPDYAYAGHPLFHPFPGYSDCRSGMRTAARSLRRGSDHGGVAVRRRQRGLWQCRARAPRRPALRCGAVRDGFCCGGSLRGGSVCGGSLCDDILCNGSLYKGPLCDGSFRKG
jgi:hypothetical protein